MIGIFFLFGNWGFLVHRTLHQLAIYKLPEPLALFYFAHAKQLVESSVNPDLRRKTDLSEETKHFIDLDSPMYRGKSIPNSWERVIKIYPVAKVHKEGTLPWEIKKTYLGLIDAFKNKNKELILLLSSDLGHYLADACVPLHTTQNYDGQLSNQKGMHDLWETLCPQLYLADYSLYSTAPVVEIVDIDKEIWKTLRQSEKLVKRGFEAESMASKAFEGKEKYNVQLRNGVEEKKYSAEFAKVYHPFVGKTINTQILTSANLISNFWYSAWAKAGKPNLEDIYIQKPELNTNLNNEIEAWKKEALLQKKLLRAKNGNN